MENFTYQNETKVIFGKDAELNLKEEMKPFGKKILLHYGGTSIQENGLYKRILQNLQSLDVTIIELSGVQPNPRLSLVQKGINICKEKKVDFILAVGGGSVIDSAKAIAIGAKYGGNVWDYFTGIKKEGSALPLGAVLTIPATGSEANPTTVITNENGWYKKGYSHESMRPKFAIMNPEITYSLSNDQTAAGCADIMSHVFERYFTRTQNVELTDRLCEGTLKTVINNAPIVLKEPKNYAARAELMWANTVAHNGFLGVGRKEDWASHMIAHELGAIYDIAHGATLSIVIPAWMKYVYKNDLNRFAQFAIKVWDVDPTLNNLDEIARQGIEKTKSFFRDIGLPITLTEAGVSRERILEMAKKCTAKGPIGQFQKLDQEDVFNIFELAL